MIGGDSLDDGGPRIGGAADQALLEQRRRQEAAQQRLGSSGTERCLVAWSRTSSIAWK